MLRRTVYRKEESTFVSQNLRGQVLCLAELISLYEIFMFWFRHKFFKPSFSDLNESRRNPHLVKGRDNLEVIGYSKDLMGAGAAAVPRKRGYSDEKVRGFNASSRCCEAMNCLEVFISDATGSQTISKGMHEIRKGANQLIVSMTKIGCQEVDEVWNVYLKIRLNSQAKNQSFLWCHLSWGTLDEAGGELPFLIGRWSLPCD